MSQALYRERFQAGMKAPRARLEAGERAVLRVLGASGCERSMRSAASPGRRWEARDGSQWRVL